MQDSSEVDQFISTVVWLPHAIFSLGSFTFGFLAAHWCSDCITTETIWSKVLIGTVIGIGSGTSLIQLVLTMMTLWRQTRAFGFLILTVCLYGFPTAIIYGWFGAIGGVTALITK